MKLHSKLGVIVLIAFALTGCFDERLLAGQSCRDDEECPPELLCSFECCGCTQWCEDHDNDGFGGDRCVGAVGKPEQEAGEAFVWADNGDDCDDADNRTFPGAAALEDTNACVSDIDGDGWAAQAPASAAIMSGRDCDDADASTHPGAAELDDPDACMTDADDDGWGASLGLVAGVVAGDDCDDRDPTLFACGVCNLLENGDAEAGTEPWSGRIITVDRSFDETEGKEILPISGDFFFVVGWEPPFADCETMPDGLPRCRAEQTILFDEIVGTSDPPARFRLRGYLHAWEQDGMENDWSSLSLRLLSAVDDTEVPCDEKATSNLSDWTLKEVTCELPNTPVKGAVVVLEGVHGQGAGADKYLDAYFDELMLFVESCPGSAG